MKKYVIPTIEIETIAMQELLTLSPNSLDLIIEDEDWGGLL